jgi:hypothetical protein
MIEKDLKTLLEVVEKNGTWKQKKAYNNIVNHCDFLDNNFKEKSEFVEKFVAWYIDQSLMTNIDKWESLSELHIKKLLLDKISFILSYPIEKTLRSIEYSVLYIDLSNNVEPKEQGFVSSTFKDIIRDYVAKKTKDNYATTENKLRK